MRDLILILGFIAYIIGGYFVVEKAEKFIKENCKGYDYDDDEAETASALQDGETENKPLNKIKK